MLKEECVGLKQKVKMGGIVAVVLLVLVVLEAVLLLS